MKLTECDSAAGGEKIDPQPATDNEQLVDIPCQVATIIKSSNEWSTIMIQAGIKAVKNNLSRFLAQVKAGEEVMTTERGKPVACIIRENSQSLTSRTALAPLIEKGLVVMPNSRIRKNNSSTAPTAPQRVNGLISC